MGMAPPSLHHVGLASLGLWIQNLAQVPKTHGNSCVTTSALLDPIKDRGMPWLVHEVVRDGNCATEALCDMSEA